MTQPMPAHAAVWFEIPVTDIERSRAFYGAVLQSDLSLNEDGPNPMAIFAARDDASVSGHLYPGKPAAAGTGADVTPASRPICPGATLVATANHTLPASSGATAYGNLPAPRW